MVVELFFCRLRTCGNFAELSLLGDMPLGDRLFYRLDFWERIEGRKGASSGWRLARGAICLAEVTRFIVSN